MVYASVATNSTTAPNRIMIDAMTTKASIGYCFLSSTLAFFPAILS